MLMSIVVWAQVTVFTHVMSYDVDWDRLGTLGRAPRTRETLPDFRESCRVTRHSRVFRRLTGCQRTPGNGVSHNDLVPTSCASTLVCIERDQLRVIILY